MLSKANREDSGITHHSEQSSLLISSITNVHNWKFPACHMIFFQKSHKNLQPLEKLNEWNQEKRILNY